MALYLQNVSSLTNLLSPKICRLQTLSRNAAGANKAAEVILFCVLTPWCTPDRELVSSSKGRQWLCLLIAALQGFVLFFSSIIPVISLSSLTLAAPWYARVPWDLQTRGRCSNALFVFVFQAFPCGEWLRQSNKLKSCLVFLIFLFLQAGFSFLHLFSFFS